MDIYLVSGSDELCNFIKSQHFIYASYIKEKEIENKFRSFKITATSTKVERRNSTYITVLTRISNCTIFIITSNSKIGIHYPPPAN